MKMFSRLIVPGVLALLLLGSACNLPAQSPLTPIATNSATSQVPSTASPTSTLNETPAVFIPITGMDVVSLQCQFCVNDEPHAVLIMSSQAFFTVSDPNTGVTCLSAQEVNGRRILLCRGTQQVSFHLNVCVDTANCLQFPITLQPCPLTGTGTPTTLTPFSPILLTPIFPSSTPEPRNTLAPTTVVTPAPPPTEPTVMPTIIVITPSPDTEPTSNEKSTRTLQS